MPQVLDNMRRTLFMRTYKKHKEDTEREAEERKNRADLKLCAPTFENLIRETGAPRQGGPRWKQAEMAVQARSMEERGRSKLEVRKGENQSKLPTSNAKVFLNEYQDLPPLKPMLASRLCSNARVWSTEMKHKEAPRLASAPGRAATVLNVSRPSPSQDTASPERDSKTPDLKGRSFSVGKNGEVIAGLPIEMQVTAGNIAREYLKYEGMKSYTRYTGLTRLPRSEPECRTMWKSVLMNKGDKMYSNKSVISNPMEHKRQLQKIVVRFGGVAE